MTHKYSFHHEFSQMIYSIVLQPRVIANLAFSSLCTFMQINSHPSIAWYL